MKWTYKQTGFVMISALILSVLGAFSSPAAEDCQSLGPQSPEAITERLGPPFEQGDLEWCWAYTTADLITWNFAHSPAERASPIEIALLTINDMPPASRENDLTQQGGNVALALKSLQKTGRYCLDSVLPGDNPRFLLAKELQELEHPSTVSCGGCNERQDQNDFSELQKHFLHLEGVDHFIGVSLPAGPSELLGLAEKSCSQGFQTLSSRLKLDRVKINTALRPEPRFRDFVEKTLRNGGIASVAYNLGDFLSPKQPDFNHQSSIVGQRRNPQNGSCEWLIRNSFGSRCHNSKGPIYRKGIYCEEGVVWLPRDELLHDIVDLSAISR